MNKKIRTGIAGFGMAGRDMHFTALNKGLSDIVEVTAVYNRSSIRDNPIPQISNNPAVYNDYNEFLNHPELEVIHITTPGSTHMDFISKAALKKKHIICDKPLEIMLNRIDRTLDICRKNDVSLSVCFQHRFAPHMQELKKLLDKGVLGDILGGNVHVILYRDEDYFSKSSWHGRVNGDGGTALMSQGIHYIDLMQWFMGCAAVKITKGFADRLVHTNIEAEDYAYGEVLFENNAKISILCGICFRPGIDQRIELFGTNGMVRVINSNVRLACWDGREQKGHFKGGPLAEQSSSSPVLELDNHISYFKTFYSSYAEKTEIPVSGEDARKSVEIILGIYKASETGTEVDIPYNPDYKPEFK